MTEITTIVDFATDSAKSSLGSLKSAAGDLALWELYVKARTTPSDIVNHVPRFVDLVEMLNAQHVIELGSRTGVSTIAWLYGLESTGGRLTSIDLDAAPDIGVWPNWTHIRGNDQDAEIISALEPADIVFLDTSHHYGETVKELNLYRWMVKPGGILCGHDYELPWPEGAPRADGPYPVKRAVDEFVAENGYDVMSYPDSWGLFLIRGF